VTNPVNDPALSAHLSDAALGVAQQAGASVAQFRIARHDSRGVSTRDGNVENVASDTSTALSVRVVHKGAWGFAASTDLTPDAAADAARRALEMATLSAQVSLDPVELIDEPSYGTVSWRQPIEIDAMAKSDAEVIDLLADWNSRVSGHEAVHHVDAHVAMGRDTTFFADLGNNAISQSRDRISAQLTTINISDSGFEDMRTCAPPAGRGWEYLQGTGWDWDSELAQMPEWLAEKSKAPSVEAGTWDLVIDPTNLWLTIHESVGHATELDRALGYEANYAGTTYATIDKLGSFQYGSPLMHITGDRTAEHGLSTVGYDD